ncbi:TrbM/KikA/MpfK family conjugal transfer protein [Escherichia coli]
MKPRLFISITLLSTLAFILPASAKIKGLSTAGDPCEVLICMAEKVQGAPQPDCIPVNQRFFSIRAYTPFYNPGATYVARQNFLYTCSGSPANQAMLNMIMQRYGRSFSS